METKPGYLTTEFWTTVFSMIIGIVQMATGAVNLNDKWVAIAMAIVVGLYNASRGIAKAGQPYVRPPLQLVKTSSSAVEDTPKK